MLGAFEISQHRVPLHRHRYQLKRRRKFPACSFLMGACPSLPESTEKGSVKVKKKTSCLKHRQGSQNCGLGGGGGHGVEERKLVDSHAFSSLTPGDDISIHADFENTCSRIVVPKAAIVARHTYLANGQTKVLTQKLSSVRGNHIISGTCASWRGKSLRVQKIRPSILGCNILRVEYSLLVSEAGAWF